MTTQRHNELTEKEMNENTIKLDNSVENAQQKIVHAKHPVSFSGAGLSAESGIATFRDKSESALWSEYNPTQLASQDGFKSDPKLVIDWYNWRRKAVAEAKPNSAHLALGSQSGWKHITQNVDWLLEDSGAIPESVFHLHGTLFEDHCNAGCGYSETIDINSPDGLRNCPKCGDYMRPSVVWFGESLPETVFEAAIAETQKADLFLVVGTSAKVTPAAGLIDLARKEGADIIVVNTEESSNLKDGDIELIGKAGDLLPRLFRKLTD